jgi:hypothetical protein
MTDATSSAPPTPASLYCTSIPSVALLDFTFGVTILLASLWAIAGAAFVCVGFKLRFAPAFTLLATFALLYCACKCAWFATDSAFVLPTPGLMFDAVARLLGCLQLVCFTAIGRSLIDSPYHDRILRRVVAALTVLALAEAAIVGVVAGLFDEFADPGNDGLIAVLLISDVLDVLVVVVSFVGAVRCAQAARDGFLTAAAQCNVKWHHSFTLFGAFFCSSRLFASFVSLILFGLLVGERDRAPLRDNIELGALFAFFVEILPLVFLVRVLASHNDSNDERQVQRTPRWLRRRLHSQHMIVIGLILFTVTLAVWGMHSSCALPAAPLGGALAAARAGAVPLYFLIPFAFVPVLYGFVSVLEAASFGTFFPRDAGDSIKLHKWLAGLAFACVAVHVAGHLSLLHSFEVFDDKSSLPPAIVQYFDEIKLLHRGIWMLPWFTGFALVALFLALWLSYACCRLRGSSPLFLQVHQISAYAALVLVAVHGAGAILKPFPYMWIGVAAALIVVAIDWLVRRRLGRDVDVELRLCVTLNEESHAVERIVVAQLLDALPKVVPGAYAGVAFPSLHARDSHPFTVVWSRSGQHAFHIACTSRVRSWTNELAHVAASTPPPLLPRLRSRVCAAFRSEISDPAFLRAPHVVMVALGTGATPFIGVADAVAVARVARLRARMRINSFNASDYEQQPRVNLDEIGMQSAESLSRSGGGGDDGDDGDDSGGGDDGGDDAPQMSFCHRSERHVVVGRVEAVDFSSVLVSAVTDCGKLWQAESDRARIPVELRLVSRAVCTLTSDSVGRTADGRMELFDVSLSERLRANVALELVDAASGRVLLAGVKPASAYAPGHQIDLVVRTMFVDWHLLGVAAGVRLVLRTPSRSVAEILARDVRVERGGAHVDLSGAIAGLGMLLTACAHDQVQVRQTRTLRTTAAAAAGTTLTTQLPWAEWLGACGDGDDDIVVDVLVGGESQPVASGAATTVCTRRDTLVAVCLAAPHAGAVAAGAALELRLSRVVAARVARRLNSARELIVHDLTPLNKRRLLDAQWTRDLWIAGERVGCTVASATALPRQSAAARLQFARQAPQLSAGDAVALHTVGAYAQLVALGASRLRNGLCTHIDRKAFWRVVNQRVVAAATSVRDGSVHVGFCGARVALAQLYEIIERARSSHGRRIEVFAEVFG